MDVITLLEHQHEGLDALFNRVLCTADERLARALFEELAQGLALHARIEERAFYPAVGRVSGWREATEWVTEHRELERLADEAIAQRSYEPFCAAVAELQRRLHAHVARERSEAFALALARLTPDDLDRLGLEVRDDAARLRKAASEAHALHHGAHAG